jgi:23S rRNA (pseudouridine1915-N3)-methyltransferase
LKFILLHLSTAKEDWCEEAIRVYSQKISHFVDFEVIALKPKKASRGDESVKLKEEAETILSFLKEGDELVLFDERGKSLTSEKFAEAIRQLHESGKKRVIFLIGGAYGVDEAVKKRAKVQISLAPFVMNHLVAQVVSLEQIYRAFTILKGLPYHNR